MQNHKVIGRICLFMFVVGCVVSLSGVDEYENKLQLLKELANSKENNQVICQIGDKTYCFDCKSKGVIIIFIGVLYNKENKLIKERVISKVTDRDGKIEYLYEKRSNFKDVLFVTCDEYKYETNLWLASEIDENNDFNYVKPIFERNVLLLADLLLP